MLVAKTMLEGNNGTVWLRFLFLVFLGGGVVWGSWCANTTHLAFVCNLLSHQLQVEEENDE